MLESAAQDAGVEWDERPVQSALSMLRRGAAAVAKWSKGWVGSLLLVYSISAQLFPGSSWGAQSAMAHAAARAAAVAKWSKRCRAAERWPSGLRGGWEACFWLASEI